MKLAVALIGLLIVLAAVVSLVWFSSSESAHVNKSPAHVRADRRLFDGAPPVIPHKSMGVACTSCHNERGLEVKGVGFAPPSPHESTPGMSAMSRCVQCHVYRQTDEQLCANEYVPFRQDLRHGRRQHQLAPPVIPHLVQMRENCWACHTGTAAREEIRTTHPERGRCLQCHATVRTTEAFTRTGKVTYPQ